MRRKDREIKDKEEMIKIIDHSTICWIAMARDNAPYIVPMNFGFKDQVVYLHSIAEGLKVDILKNNPKVCAAFTQSIELMPSAVVCETDMKYQSVLVFGKALFIKKEDKKKEALDIIVKHYYKNLLNKKIEYTTASLESIVIIKVRVQKMTGKLFL